MTSAMFKLRCVGCKRTETRPAEDCKGDQPMCNHCYMPMVLVSVTSQNLNITSRKLRGTKFKHTA